MPVGSEVNSRVRKVCSAMTWARPGSAAWVLASNGIMAAISTVGTTRAVPKSRSAVVYQPIWTSSTRAAITMVSTSRYIMKATPPRR